MLKEKLEVVKNGWNGLNKVKKASVLGLAGLVIVGGIGAGVTVHNINVKSEQALVQKQKQEEAKKKLEEAKKRDEQLAKEKQEQEAKLREEEEKLKEEEAKQKELEEKLANAKTEEEKKTVEKELNSVKQNVQTRKQNVATRKTEIKKVEERQRDNKKIIDTATKPVEPSKPNKPAEPSKPSKPVEPEKPVQPVQPEPEKPSKPTVVSTTEETKSEIKDYVNFTYTTVEDNTKAKGTSGIKTEGAKGYTTYTYKRTATKYSDGSVKYSDWTVASKNVTAPKNGVKWVGTYVKPEEPKGRIDNEQAKLAAIAINKARVANNLPEVSYTINGEYTKYNYVNFWSKNGFGHTGYHDTCIGRAGNGTSVVNLWMKSGGHRQSLLGKYSSFTVGCYVNENGIKFFTFEPNY